MFNDKNLAVCTTCKFKSDCFYNHLSAEAQKKWSELLGAKKFKDKEPIFNEGDKPNGMHIVCMGRAKIYNTDFQGQQLITSIRHPGEIFGYFALFSEANYNCAAESMGEAIISFLDKKSLDLIRCKHIEISELLLKKTAKENMLLLSKLKDTAYKPAKAKIAHALIKHISFKTKGTPNPTIYGLKRTEIAEITGLALETVVRALSDLEKKKIIKRSPSYIKILDYNALQKISMSQK